MKITVLHNGCIQEDILYNNFGKKLKEYETIERVYKVEEADLLIYMTCTGTGEIIKKCVRDLNFLNQYSKQSNLKVIVVGCLAVYHPEIFPQFSDNSQIKFINNKDWIIPTLNYILDLNKRNSFKTRLENRTLRNFPAKGQLIIEDGCLNNCSFCKVHYNGNWTKSIPFELLVNHIKNLAHDGMKIINLSGENVTLYGIDLNQKPRLHELIAEISKIPEIEIISVNELVAGNMYPELLNEIVNNPKVGHVSMQLETSSNRLLKLMNRNYTLEEYDYYVQKILNAQKSVSTVLMSSFPTETYEEIDATASYLNSRQIFTDSVCCYDDYKLIPSSKLPQLSKKERLKHFYYLTRKTREINFEILNARKDKINKMIYIGDYDGYKVFEGDNAEVRAISKRKKWDNLQIGDIIKEKPLRLVQKSGVYKI